MSKRQTIISPEQLSLSIVGDQLSVPEPTNMVSHDVITGTLPFPRSSAEIVVIEKVWPDAVDLDIYRRSMLDALTPIGAANRSHGFARAAANPDAHADIYQRYGQQVPGMAEEKGHHADRIIETSRRWFYIAQGLGDLVTAKSSELTEAQIKVRSDVQELWEAFADRYARPGPVASKRRNAYIKSLKSKPATLPFPIQYAPAEFILKLV